jgi:hypothetical protein
VDLLAEGCRAPPEQLDAGREVDCPGAAWWTPVAGCITSQSIPRHGRWVSAIYQGRRGEHRWTPDAAHVDPRGGGCHGTPM